MGDVNFKSDRKAAANRGSRAAIVAGLPSTEMEAIRQGSVQNFQDRTATLREQVKTDKEGSQAQGLGNLLQLVALMRQNKQAQPQQAQLNQLAAPQAQAQQPQPQPQSEYDVPYTPDQQSQQQVGAGAYDGISPMLLQFLMRGGMR